MHAAGSGRRLRGGTVEGDCIRLGALDGGASRRFGGRRIIIRFSWCARCAGRLRCWLVLVLRLGGRNRNGEKRARLQGVGWREVIGGDDVALLYVVFPCDPPERLAALHDDVRRDRGTGVWVITRRSGGRGNGRDLPRRGQQRNASQ